MENENTALKSSMASIGAKLRSAREKKGLAIDQVQKQTHIYSTVLVALEEGRADEILPVTYVRSFLKKYAGYLGLDSNAIAKEYSALHPEEAGKGAAANIQSAEKRQPDLLLRFIYGVSLILLLITSLSLVTFLTKKATHFFKRPRVRIITAAKGKTAVSPKARKTSTVAQTPAVQDVSIPKQVPLNIVIKTRDPVMLGVKKDGVLLFKRVMPKGASESFAPDERLEIYVAKAEAIEIILNGKSLGSPGRGVMKELEITRKGMRTR